MADVSTPMLTVAIPTWNRGEILQQVCEALLEQSIPAEEFLVLIVDNNSTDDTRQRMAMMADRFPHFSYVVEKKAGLSHARNTAWHQCTTPWIVYLDDDAKPFPRYVESILRAIASPPPCDVIAGKVVPWKLFPLPSWFLDEYESYSPHADASGHLYPKDFAYGTNMAFSCQSIRLAGGFDPRFGVRGTVVPYGEETELQVRIRQMGGRIRYAPDAVVAHLARPSRYTVSNLLRIAYRYGKSTPVIYNWQGWRQFLRLCCKVPYRLLRTLGRTLYRLCNRTYAWQNAVIALGGECLFLAGMFRGFFLLATMKRRSSTNPAE
ncbi:glycosyltransferase [uncultured Desulfovibrio sp.]|uniref:glycosyltransferase family 2 protein n=1 Tax=uncultured Desulfovibrio sp. TaxID=167968 RepID=UPI0026218709|nr:glycosyltransferase [uncultured Desulfovibrio sp.]